MTAKQTFLAFLNPYQSVVTVYPNVVNEQNAIYLGVKQTSEIVPEFIAELQQYDIYKHTIDKASHNGRAVDVMLKNPITNHVMTGSSSGTALNVFLGINDLGLGTDGGGSVLAPAAALNLYSVISPYFTQKYTDKLTPKQSTDGIAFKVSYGFISRDVSLISDLLRRFSPVDVVESANIITDSFELKEKLNNVQMTVEEMTDKYALSRVQLMKNLEHYLNEYDMVISQEGPVDWHGMGDTIIGHFDDMTQQHQSKGNKGYLKVVNMLGLTAVTIPSEHFATAYVVIVKSTPKGIAHLIHVIEQLPQYHNPLIEHYFRNIDGYFVNGVHVGK